MNITVEYWFTCIDLPVHLIHFKQNLTGLLRHNILSLIYCVLYCRLRQIMKVITGNRLPRNQKWVQRENPLQRRPKENFKDNQTVHVDVC